MRPVPGRDVAPDVEETEGLRGAAVAAVAVVEETCMEDGRARFWTVRVEGAEGLVVEVDGTVEGRGLKVEMVLLRLCPVVVVEVDAIGFAVT